MKNRVLLAVVVAAGVAWLAGDKLASWVRPVALAVFAGSLALLLWPRIRPRPSSPPSSSSAASGSSASSSSPSSASASASASSSSSEGPESTKDLWDAVDRGEDPTTR